MDAQSDEQKWAQAYREYAEGMRRLEQARDKTQPLHPVERRARDLAFRYYQDRNPDCDVEDAIDYEVIAWRLFEVEAMEELWWPGDDDRDVPEEEYERRLAIIDEVEEQLRMEELEGDEPDPLPMPPAAPSRAGWFLKQGPGPAPDEDVAPDAVVTT